jgi:hypothetical protein
MQFIAECGIEYGLQFVTQFFLNSPDCLYTKKSCEFFQSYKKKYLCKRIKLYEKDQIVIYQTEDRQTQIDVRLENETVWLTQAQMAELFETDRTSIVRHNNNIYRADELEREATCAKIAQVQTEGKRTPQHLTFLC